MSCSKYFPLERKFHFVIPPYSRSALPGADIPDPPQCDQLLDCAWPEQHDPSCPNIPVEPALEATEYTVRAIESESRPVSLKRNKSNLEGSVAIEMSSQPLLELTPMTGTTSVSVFYRET